MHTNCYVHSLLDKQDGIYTPRYAPNGEDVAQEHKADKDPSGYSVSLAQSRILTKKQISDMAFGIRELAKKLAHIRLRMDVRNVFVLTKAHDESLISKTREVTEWLLKKDKAYTVYASATAIPTFSRS